MIKVDDKGFYKMLISISIPIALQNLMSFMINMLDTVMLGSLGEIQLSAGNLANQPFFIFNIITFGLSGGGAVLSSQFWGKKDILSIRQVISIVVRISIIISIIFSFIVIFFPKNVMNIYTDDIEIALEGVKYLKIIGFSYLFFGITNTFLCSIRSLEIVRISVFSNIVALLINIFFNWTFIFGNLGFPELGIKGAAISTLISRIVEFIIVIVYAFFIDRKLCIKISDFSKVNFLILKKLINHSLPVVLNEAVWALGISFQSIIIGRLGYESISAYSINSIIQELSTVVVFGVANAAAILVGKAIGEGDIIKAKSRSNRFVVISVMFGLFGAIIIILFRDVFVNFYNVSDSTKELAKQVILVCAFITFFTSISATFIIGILRGSADTKYALILETITLWLISLPFAYSAAFIFKLPVYYVYAFMQLDEVIKAIVCFFRTRGTKWIKDVTTSNAKL